jgi:hypothetical protein
MVILFVLSRYQGLPGDRCVLLLTESQGQAERCLSVEVSVRTLVEKAETGSTTADLRRRRDSIQGNPQTDPGAAAEPPERL